MVHTIALEWKAFNLDCNIVRDWAKANLANCSGASANSKFEVHFTEQPTEDDRAALELHWESMTEESEEALAYKSEQERKAEKEAKKESAKNKLLDLGLTEDEISAMIG